MVGKRSFPFGMAQPGRCELLVSGKFMLPIAQKRSSRPTDTELFQAHSTRNNNGETKKTALTYFPWNPGCLMTGSLQWFITIPTYLGGRISSPKNTLKQPQGALFSLLNSTHPQPTEPLNPPYYHHLVPAKPVPRVFNHASQSKKAHKHQPCSGGN